MRARWDFGHVMLRRRGDDDRMPYGYIQQLCVETHKSARELHYRRKFAETYPTEAEFSTAVESFDSWTASRPHPT